MKQKFDQSGFDPSQIRNLKDLEKIPVTTRDEFIELQRIDPPFGGFLAVPIQSLKRIYIHPGPQYEILGDEDIKHAQNVLYKIGARKGEIVINTLSYHLVAAGMLVDEPLVSAGVTIVPTGPGNTDLQVQIIRDLKATVFLGFPSFLMTVIKRAEELGYDFRRDCSIRYALAAGAPEIRKSLEEDYGINTREWYGFLPIGLPACECELKSGMQIEEDFVFPFPR